MAANNYNARLSALLLLFFSSALLAQKPSEEQLSTSFKESRKIFSYTQGQALGQSLAHHTTSMDIEAFLQGIRDAYNKKKNPYSMLQIASASQLIEPLLKEGQEDLQQQVDMQVLQKNLLAEKNFLKKNAKVVGVRETSSSLQYRSLLSGSGNTAKKGDRLVVHYQARLLDGTVFEHSAKGRGQELFFDALIPGLQEGLQHLREGGTMEFYIPHSLAYGKNSRGIIPPASLVIYYITLEKILLPEVNQVKTTKN